MAQTLKLLRTTKCNRVAISAARSAASSYPANEGHREELLYSTVQDLQYNKQPETDNHIFHQTATTEEAARCNATISRFRFASLQSPVLSASVSPHTPVSLSCPLPRGSCSVQHDKSLLGLSTYRNSLPRIVQMRYSDICLF